MPEQVPDLPVEEFASAKAWERWLRANHATAPGLWLKIAKKGTGVTTVEFVDAIEVALCYGWIDGLRHKHDDVYFRQRFTPRKPRSKWSIDQPRPGRGTDRGGPDATRRAGARSTRRRPTVAGTLPTPASRTIEVPDA